MESKVLTPLKAIRAKCLDCSAYQPKEVRFCLDKECSLYAYRLGNNPNRSGIGNKKGLPAGKAPAQMGISQVKELNSSLG